MMMLKSSLFLLFVVALISSYVSCDNNINTPRRSRLSQLIYSTSEREEYLMKDYENSLRKNLNGADLPLPHTVAQFNENNMMTHQCVHDQLEKDNLPEKKPKRKSSSRGELDEAISAATDTNDGTTHPFKIVLNATYLNPANEPQTCSYVNQKVKIGSPTSGSTTTPCSDTSGRPCIWTCTANDIVDSTFQSAIQDIVMSKVVTFFQETLTIKGSAGITKTSSLKTYPCSEQFIQLDPNYATVGFDGDMVLYVSAHPINGQTIAYASSCTYDQTTTRPLVAFINLNAKYFSGFVTSNSRQGPQWEQYFRVLMHEVTHGLAFSDSLMDYWLDPSTGSEYDSSPIQTIVEKGASPSGESFSRERYYLTTPAVTEFTRNHFDCQDLVGAELENVGGGGTIMSHWKGTPFGEEAMIGYSQVMAPYSNLTFALLKDSGWYGINMDGIAQYSEPLIWGRKLGCGFANGCSANSWNYQGYWDFTDKAPGTPGCSATRSGKGTLYITQFNRALPPYQQHFTDPTVGGPYDFKDFCPYTDVFGYSKVTDINVYCLDPSGTPDTSVSEYFGDDSRCFEYSASGQSTISQVCWKNRCNGNVLEIQFQDQWYGCESEGQNITLPGDVTFHCPLNYYPCELQPLEGGSISSANSLTLPSWLVLMIVFTISILLN